MSKNLQNFRQQLNKIDKKLLNLLAERFEITKKIGKYKAKYSLPICDKKRERKIIKEQDLLVKKLRLDKRLVREIFQAIFKTVKANHKKIKRNKYDSKKAPYWNYWRKGKDGNLV